MQFPIGVRMILALPILVLALPAQAVECKKLNGATDHPLFPVYEGSCQIAYENRSFDEYTQVQGKLVSGAIEKQQSVEGSVERKIYSIPEERTPLEVFRNYQQGLTKRGYEVLYSCKNDECGPTKPFLAQVYPPDERKKAKAPQPDMAFYALSGKPDQYYLAAKKPDGSAYVSLLVGNHQNLSTRIGHRTIVLADIVEVTQLEGNLVDADAMSKSIQETGKVALQNIYFDTGKSVLKPESKPALDEMAKLLKGDPALKVYVVGHTDNVGKYEDNLVLSRTRAEAVVKTLQTQYGIPGGQMVPAGVASLGPLASNNSEQGRAKNRRVELVQR